MVASLTLPVTAARYGAITIPLKEEPVADAILINVILDKSGSMESKRADVIGGFNAFVAEQRKAPGRARLIVTQFNTDVTPPTPAVPIDEVLPLTPERYTPGGNTALFDAIA